MKTILPPAFAAGAVLLAPARAAGFDAAAAPFILNSLFLLICGALVMFMAAGFTMLEAGSVRARSVVSIIIKNITLYSIAGLMFYLVGYNLLFGVAEGGLAGVPVIWAPDDAAAFASGDEPAFAQNAFWFFQMVFVATAASVVSGCLAERIRLWPFLVFVAVLSGAIYPLVGSWIWGGGWLAALGFQDFAGSTVVHSVGGWAALAGALLLGPRRGRFGAAGRRQAMPYASAPQVAIGVFILWFGWFGFNGGSQLSFSSVEDAIAVSAIMANTNAAAAGGVLTTLILSRIIGGRPDILLTLNGALAGLVAITAEPAAPSIGAAMLIGSGGGMVMVAVTRMLERFRIDDVVGAVPVHLGAGVYGTLAAGVTNDDANMLTQVFGIVVIGAFVFGASLLAWAVIRAVLGLRLNSIAEDLGADLSEMGVRAYHFEFTAASPTRSVQEEHA